MKIHIIIVDETKQYNTYRKAPKVLTFLSGKIDKYEYFINRK